jgi:phage/plasmid-like protein (TIGR03299 family)
MTNELFNLSGSNQKLADGARGDVIPVKIETVRNYDPAEFGGARTITERRTNHLITTKDRLGMYRQKGWHGLGQVIEDGMTGEEAVREFLPWSIERVQSFVTIDGAAKPLPVWANVRSDTREILGVVGPEYTPVQNIDLGRFADAMVGADSAVQMETCGSLLGGRKVFLLVRVPREVRVGKNGDDVSVPFLLLANGHDGSMAMTVLWTIERVVCNNSYTRALGAVSGSLAEGTAFRIKHVGDVAGQLEEARRVLGIAAKGLTQYEEQARALAATSKPISAIEEYFRSVFEAQFGAKPEDDLDATAWEIRRDKVVGEWMTLLDSETNTIDGIGGTLWAALNAITEWNDHRRSPGVKGDRRDHLRVLGAGAAAKRHAMRLALAAV